MEFELEDGISDSEAVVLLEEEPGEIKASSPKRVLAGLDSDCLAAIFEFAFPEWAPKLIAGPPSVAGKASPR